MGADKATLVVDGAPLGRRSVDALHGAGIRHVVLVGGNDHHTLVLGAGVSLEAIADDRPGEGPLPAVLTALRHARGEAATHVVVLACDLPHVGSADVECLVAAATQERAVEILMSTVGGISAYPNGVWAVSVTPALEALVDGGERGFGAIPAHLLDHIEMGKPFTDADRPGDLPPSRYPDRP